MRTGRGWSCSPVSRNQNSFICFIPFRSDTKSKRMTDKKSRLGGFHAQAHKNINLRQVSDDININNNFTLKNVEGGYNVPGLSFPMLLSLNQTNPDIKDTSCNNLGFTHWRKAKHLVRNDAAAQLTGTRLAKSEEPKGVLWVKPEWCRMFVDKKAEN